MIDYREFIESDLEPLCQLATIEGWDSFRDLDLARRALTAPGCVVIVAVRQNRRMGFIQIQTDQGIHAHISNILVSGDARSRGIGRRLVEIAFSKSGAKYIDLVSTEGSDDFYRSFTHQEFQGFRLYPDK